MTTIITVRYYSVDSYGRATARKFKTLAGAHKFAASMVGRFPTFGSNYAVSDDGVGKVTVQGCTLRELFPEPGSTPSVAEAERAEREAAKS